MCFVLLNFLKKYRKKMHFHKKLSRKTGVNIFNKKEEEDWKDHNDFTHNIIKVN